MPGIIGTSRGKTLGKQPSLSHTTWGGVALRAMPISKGFIWGLHGSIQTHQLNESL